MKRSISYVPVFVDNTNYADELAMTRLTYFYVECVEPHPVGLMDDEDVLPILLIDLEGVIVSGLGEADRFNSPKIIRELFDYIDEQTPYVISANYIWLQNALINRFVDKRLVRGDVLRVSTPLFVHACRGAEGSKGADLRDTELADKPVYYSEEETLAFKEWTDTVVDRAKKRYREQPELNLRTRVLRKER